MSNRFRGVLSIYGLKRKRLLGGWRSLNKQRGESRGSRWVSVLHKEIVISPNAVVLKSRWLARSEDTLGYDDLERGGGI